jgi:hypothetical protein
MVGAVGALGLAASFWQRWPAMRVVASVDKAVMVSVDKAVMVSVDEAVMASVGKAVEAV